MKKIFWGVFLGILASCHPEKESEKDVSYLKKLDAVEYCIQYPTDWIISENDSTTCAKFSIQKNEKIKNGEKGIYLYEEDLSAYGNHLSVEEYTEYSNIEFMMDHEESELLKSFTVKNRNGVSFGVNLYTIHVDSIKYMVKEQITLKNNKAYVLKSKCNANDTATITLLTKIGNSFIVK